MNCDRKIRHRTRERAEHTALMMQRHHGGTFETYHCDECDGWHVANSRIMGAFRKGGIEAVERVVAKMRGTS